MKYLSQSLAGADLEIALFQVMDFVPIPLILSEAVGSDQSEDIHFRVHRHVNRAFLGEVGYSLEEMPNIESWFTLAYPDAQYRNRIKDQWAEVVSHGALTGQTTVEMPALVQCGNGEKRWFEIKAEIGTARLSKWHMISLRDVHDMRNALEEVGRLATLDPLTGLANRRAAHRFLEQEWNIFQEAGQEFSLILADVDHFKEVNDNYGHQGGDLLLCRLANVLRRATREIDCVARWGGEEFLIILPGVGRDDVGSVAERLRRTVEDQAPSSISVTMSLGCATMATDHSITALILAADQALYAAKERGRNCVVVNTESLVLRQRRGE